MLSMANLNLALKFVVHAANGNVASTGIMTATSSMVSKATLVSTGNLSVDGSKFVVLGASAVRLADLEHAHVFRVVLPPHAAVACCNC